LTSTQDKTLEINDGLGGSFSGAVELVRVARLQDLPGAVALWHRCGLVMAGHDPTSDYTLSLKEAATVVLVAVTPANEVIGTGMAEKDGVQGYLWYVAVCPANRDEGVGRLIDEACEQWLLQHGVSRVELSLQTDDIGVLSTARVCVGPAETDA
jgi:GNAT superfamily N-acetyltransferase